MGLIEKLNKMTACEAALYLYKKGIKMEFAQKIAKKYSYFRLIKPIA